MSTVQNSGCTVDTSVAGQATMNLRGNLSITHAREISEAFESTELAGIRQVTIDGAAMHQMDTSIAWLLLKNARRFRRADVEVEFLNLDTSLLDYIESLPVPEQAAEIDHRLGPRKWLAAFGRWDLEQITQRGDDLSYIGRVFSAMWKGIINPNLIRWRPIVKHVEFTGVRAIPIVALIAFLISIVIGYLGAQQLRPFGAEIFTVDLVAIGVLREMGVLLTGIIIAGRSGSAFAAELGVMRLDEEIDALQMMGLAPMDLLVLPRIAALVIVMPALTIVADAMGLAGGAVLLNLLLDLSLVEFLSRLREALSPTTFWVGLIKAPVFGMIIAIIGTLRGMQVERSAEALGRQTTTAVVQSIFCIILADALFAIAFMELDI